MSVFDKPPLPPFPLALSLTARCCHLPPAPPLVAHQRGNEPASCHTPPHPGPASTPRPCPARPCATRPGPACRVAPSLRRHSAVLESSAGPSLAVPGARRAERTRTRRAPPSDQRAFNLYPVRQIRLQHEPRHPPHRRSPVHERLGSAGPASAARTPTRSRPAAMPWQRAEARRFIRAEARRFIRAWARLQVTAKFPSPESHHPGRGRAGRLARCGSRGRG
jgi:hypothetical protein